MNRNLILLAVIAVAVPVCAAQAAEIDTVYRKSDSKAVAGEISSSSKTEIVVSQKIGNREEHIPANDIERVEWKQEPPVLGLGRGNERMGKLDAALNAYQEAKGTVSSTTSPLASEIDFLICRVQARMAAADIERASEALEKLSQFTEAHPDHYRYYDAQLLLGDTALLAGNASAADSAFLRLEQSPWGDYQMAGKLGAARVLIQKGKFGEAKTKFDEIVARKPSTPAEKARQLEAMLGQAQALTGLKQAAPAVKVLEKVIDETPTTESRVLASAYLELGKCHAADSQQTREAVLAYLHVDVIPTLAAHGDLHAEALYNLSRLWPAIGQPGRGAEASSRLEQEYPSSPWAKKLAEGT